MPSPDAGAFPESPGAVGNRREQPAPDKPKSSEEFSSDEPVPTDNVEEMQHVTSGWKGWIIPIDLVEKENEYIVFADLPGATLPNIRLETEGNMLIIRAKRATEVPSEETGGNFKVWSKERGNGEIARVISLPFSVVDANCTASFANGVLTVWIKKPAQRKPKKQAIEIGSKHHDHQNRSWSL